MKLHGTQTHANLKRAFEVESAASVMYRWSAQQANVEGQPDVAKHFNAIAEVKVGQGIGHLEYLVEAGDLASGVSLGDAVDNLEAARAAEAAKHNDLYPAFAAVARDEGLEEIAEWLDSVTRANETHAAGFAEIEIEP